VVGILLPRCGNFIMAKLKSSISIVVKFGRKVTIDIKKWGRGICFYCVFYLISSLGYINGIIAYQNKNHTFNWLNTLHVTFTIPRYRLECWFRLVQKPCINWYYWSIHGNLFVYVLINYNVTYNLLLFLIISWTPFKQLL